MLVIDGHPCATRSAGEFRSRYEAVHPPATTSETPVSNNVHRPLSERRHNARDEELKYFRKNGFFPIMHILAFKEDVLKSNPWVAGGVMKAFEQANEVCRHYYDDPNWSWLAWGKHFMEEQQNLLGDNPWPSGVERNRANLERFMGYSLDQGLMARKMKVEELFHKSAIDA